MTTTICPQNLNDTTSIRSPNSLDCKDPAASMLEQGTAVDPVSNNSHSAFDTHHIGLSSSRPTSEEAAENAQVDDVEAHHDGLNDPNGYYRNAYNNLDRSDTSQSHDQEELSDLNSALSTTRNVLRKPAALGGRPATSHSRKSVDRRSVSFVPQNFRLNPEHEPDISVRVQGRIVTQSGKNYGGYFHTDSLENTGFMPFDYINEESGMHHGSEYDNMQAHRSGQASMLETSKEYEGDDEEQEADGEGDDDFIFFPETSTRRPNRVEKSRAGHQATGVRSLVHQSSDTNSISDHPAVARRGRSHGRLGFEFSTPNNHLAPSRYSGAMMPWGVNQRPVMTGQENVSDASLMKRGITRPPKGERVCKRSYGVNDPENIAIVNLKENTDMTFQEIVDKLNEERVKVGKDPKLTVCGVNGRYNRTAPIMFAAQGLHFVPLSERKKNGDCHGKRTKKAGWDPEDDKVLVETVKYIDTEKWRRVADILNRELRGGRQVYDADACAKR